MLPASRPAVGARRATIIVTLFALTAAPANVAAQDPSQDLVVDPASQALWFAGVVLLGLLIAYYFMRNRSRTRTEKQTTDEAAKTLYAKEERHRAE